MVEEGIYCSYVFSLKIHVSPLSRSSTEASEEDAQNGFQMEAKYPWTHEGAVQILCSVTCLSAQPRAFLDTLPSYTDM